VRCGWLGQQASALSIGQQVTTAAKGWIAHSDVGTPVGQTLAGIEQTISCLDTGTLRASGVKDMGVEFQAQDIEPGRKTTTTPLVEQDPVPRCQIDHAPL
jgi:hypothetical protein|tara:strand:- start:102 stop:401 length:300 start_codon:yes stop_codon:yes gene_type:complete